MSRPCKRTAACITSMASCLIPLLTMAVLLPLTVRATSTSMPRFKWGQNKQLIFLSVLVRDLDTDSMSMSLTTEGDVFSFRAKNTEGNEFVLDLPLREDVVSENIKWEVSKRADKAGDKPIVVTLTKRNDHRWDTLVTNPKKFKGNMDKDWTREDQNLEVEEEVPYVEDHGSYIQALSEKNFNKTVAKFSAVMVNVRYPWCSDCKAMDDTFAKAAKLAKLTWKRDAVWKRAAFTVVDAREQRKLGRWLNASCSYDCTIKVFAGLDEEPIKVKPKSDELGFLYDIIKYLHPTVHVLKAPEEVEPFRKKNTTCLGRFISEASANYALFKHVADMMRGDLVFTAIFGEEKTVEIWPYEQNFSYEYDGTWADNGTTLLEWIKVRSTPLLQHFTWTMHDYYESLKLPIGKLWIDNEMKNTSLTKLAKQAVERLARKYVGRIVFTFMNKTSYYYELKEFGLNLPQETYPAFGIASNGSYECQKYGFEITSEIAPSVEEFWRDADKTVGVLSRFCDQVLAGTWPEAHESGPVQTNWTKGMVKELVYRSYNEIRNPERPLLLEIYGKYRRENDKKLKEVENLAKVLEPHAETFTIASYDTTQNYIPQEDFKRVKYASETEWYWVPQKVDGIEKLITKKLTKPKKDAPIKTVVEFLKKHSGLDIDIDDVMNRFEEQMIVNPPPTTTPPPPLPSVDGPGFTEFNVQEKQGSIDGSNGDAGGETDEGDDDSKVGADDDRGKEEL